MKDTFKKTVIWTNTEPPKNYLWAKDNKVYEYLEGWIESKLFSKEYIPVNRVDLNKTKLNMRVGRTANLVAVVEPEETTDKTITWVSSDPDVVEVSCCGKVLAKSEGTATIFTTIGGKSDRCEVVVS